MSASRRASTTTTSKTYIGAMRWLMGATTAMSWPMKR